MQTFTGQFYVNKKCLPYGVKFYPCKKGRNIIPALVDSLALKKNEFLMNKHNKQEFLLMLENQIFDPGISVYNANTDADLLL